MESVRHGRWEINYDSEATRNAYARVLAGAPEACGCEHCLNFVAARMQVYPPKALELLERLGISPNREVEIYYTAPLPSGGHLYGGWFHFIGSILSGADAWRQVAENSWQPDLELAGENFSLGFSSRLALVRGPFAGSPLVQLEFTANVPWVLASSEPT